MAASEISRFSRFSGEDTLNAQFSSYVVHLENKNLSPRTVETYGDCLLTFCRWMAAEGKETLGRLTSADLQDFQIWLSREYKRGRGGRFSGSHQAKHIAVVRDFFRFLQAECQVLGNPAGSIRYPKLKRKLRRDVLTAEELRKLLDVPVRDAKGMRDMLAIRLLALSGLRASELCALDVEDVNIAEREIIIRGGKGNKDRLTFCDEGTRELLTGYLAQAWHRLIEEDTQALILGNGGGRLHYHELRAAVKKMARAAGIRKHITPHSLRHTFCTLLLTHGCNLKVIAELAGHASLGTTARYTRVDIRELAEVYHHAHPRSSS